MFPVLTTDLFQPKRRNILSSPRSALRRSCSASGRRRLFALLNTYARLSVQLETLPVFINLDFNPTHCAECKAKNAPPRRRAASYSPQFQRGTVGDCCQRACRPKQRQREADAHAPEVDRPQAPTDCGTNSHWRFKRPERRWPLFELRTVCSSGRGPALSKFNVAPPATS